MVYDRHSTYLTWGGRLGSDLATKETWQTGVHLALNPSLDGPGLPDVAELQTLYTDVLIPFHSNATLSLSAGAVMEWVRAASLDPAGHYTTDPVHYDGTGTPGGAGTGNGASPQDSLCITLYSGSQFGRANYGRLYLPWWSQWVATSNGRVINPDGLDTPVQTLMNGINTWAAAALSSTARIRIMSSVGSGATKRAAVARIGDVKDTQRRRRAQIRESYRSVSIAP